MAEVFINYRTGDGDEAAEFLASRLSDRFGKEHVFKASRSIQVARLVDGHDQKAADEMRWRHSRPDGRDVADGYWGYPGEAEGTPPE